MEQQPITPEQIIRQEIKMHEAEARLCRAFAAQIPARSKYLTRRAEQNETAASNAKLFLKGREILSATHEGAVLESGEVENELERARR